MIIDLEDEDDTDCQRLVGMGIAPALAREAFASSCGAGADRLVTAYQYCLDRQIAEDLAAQEGSTHDDAALAAAMASEVAVSQALPWP